MSLITKYIKSIIIMSRPQDTCRLFIILVILCLSYGDKWGMVTQHSHSHSIALLSAAIPLPNRGPLNHLFFLGYQPTIPLLCPLGRQPFHSRWTPDLDIPAVPHLRTMYTFCLYPSTCLLCPVGGFPGTVPPGGQGAWQVKACCCLFASASHTNSFNFCW